MSDSSAVAASAIKRKVFTTAAKSRKDSESPVASPVAIKMDEARNDGKVEERKQKDSNERPKKTKSRNNKNKTTQPEISAVDSGLLEKLSLNVDAKPFSPLAPQATPFQSKNSEESPKPKSSEANRAPVARPKPRQSKGEELRDVEIKQLKIRFSPTGFAQKKNPEDSSINLQCVMPITDPDFPFDLPSIRIEMILPLRYPGTKSDPIRPVMNILNSDLPATIISRIERNLKWGMNSLEGGVLICRPVLKFLEENLEKWLVDEAKEAAFKFVAASDIQVSAGKVVGERVPEVNESAFNNQSGGIVKATSSGSNSSSASKRFSVGDWISPPPVTDHSVVGGTPYSVSVHFSICKGIDLLTSQRISFLVCCDRCRFNFPVEDLRPFVDRIEHCPKCTSQTKYYYKAQLITPNGDFEESDCPFEGILGIVRFLRAKPVDLLPSLMQCACSRCFGLASDDEEGSSKPLDDQASSCKIEKVRIGEQIAYNCFRCHQKTRLQLDHIEWQHVESINSPMSSTKSQTPRKAALGPALAIGTPLPANGSCSHYKKSFRWYRFPCCGQAFPCDECHAADTAAKLHPVEWANRFICGFCSREQSISVKECPECGKDTSAAGLRRTAFWEGGKGTRNQAFMSRKDSKKYKDYSTNSVNSKQKPAKKQTNK